MPPKVLDQALWARLDALTKPRRALGRLETLAHQIGMIQGTDRPTISRPRLLIFAGDHGITAEGVSLYPQIVTSQMVANFLAGGAAATVFATLHQVETVVVNAGLAHPIPTRPPVAASRGARLLQWPIGPGTRNFAHGPAMTMTEMEKGLSLGETVVDQEGGNGTNTLLFGEMGIGNSSSAALLISCLLNVPVATCVGRGTGLGDRAFARKVETLEKARRMFPGDPSSVRDVACYFGGYEIMMMAGAYMAAFDRQLVCLVDGLISSAAYLVALRLKPELAGYGIFCHTSREQGHTAILRHLNASALLDLDLALGEGTGALLALPLLKAACAMMHDMATFDSALVSTPRPVNETATDDQEHA